MWLFLGLISAISDASKNVLAKHNTKTFNSFVVTWAWSTYSLIFLLPLMFFGGIPSLDTSFWVAFVLVIILDFVSLLLYVEGIKRSELSLSLPLLAFTPLFLLLSGFLIGKEFPSVQGLIGVLCIMVGAYLLNFKKNQKHLLEPFQHLFNDTGSKMMLGVAVVWGVTGSLHKVAIQHSNAYFYSGFSVLVLSLLFTPLAYFSDKAQFLEAIKPKNLKQLVPVGLLDGLTVLTQMLGQSIALSVLVISLKRTSIIFSSVLSWYFFKENIKQRLFPITIMVCGVILIALS
jgi:drug/metabolite transporter (DMT)-like permease